MHVLHGAITSGFGVAARNLVHVVPLIAARTGLTRLTPGTLNVRLPAPFFVEADAAVTADEYDGHEHLKLQRCVVGGIRAVIVRPHKHETVPGWGHGPNYLELVSAVHLRRALGLWEGDPVRIEVGGNAAWWARASGGEIQFFKSRVRRVQWYVSRTWQPAA